MQTLEKRSDRNSNVWKPKRSDRFPAQAAESTGLLRTWEASQESLRTSLVKAHRRVTALKMQFASFGVSLRALSGASCDASEEVSVFRPRRCLERIASFEEDERVRIEQKEHGNESKHKYKVLFWAW